MDHLKSLYEEMGGETALRAVLRTLYDRLFEDRMVGFLFAGKDKERLIELQLWFTAGFLGGPKKYEGRGVIEAHAELPILPGHFDRRHLMLEQVLEEHGVPRRVREEWLRVDAGLRGSVLKSGEQAREKGKEPR
jgi:truncated hemoglobin YjbI